ncbi:MAG: DsbE family thiol:disulfide interchange protein [Alphaproteobacteria bacterium]|nr:MAG: DsbE family thiol:disulfide interchange protein [Alphaproteobacteria bacterium]
MKRLILWAPLAVFAGFLMVVAFGLKRPPDPAIHSKLVGKPMPAFELKPAVAEHPGLSSEDLKQGAPRLVNVFASWCVPCIAEAPVLMELKRRGVPIDGIAIRDRGEDVAAFLARNRDPYAHIGTDPNSQVQLALGSSGVPETFVVDGKGVIRLQHIGAINPNELGDIIAALEAAK